MNDKEFNDIDVVNEPGDFLNAGVNIVAYIRPVTLPEGRGFAIHAANGERYAVAPTAASAYGFIKQNDMEPVGLH